MQHGSSIRKNRYDPSWTYREEKWMAHAWARHGHTCYSRYLHFWKREFNRMERRCAKREIQQALGD